MLPNRSKLPPDADRVLISVNPIAGARSAQSRVDRLAELLSQQGFKAEVLNDLDEVARRADQWHVEGHLRALVAVGGDGTAAELVNRTQLGVPLTLLPSGNENLLARYLGLGREPESVCRAICDGRLMRLDAGEANGRVFLLMIGCGFDADVVRRLHQRRRGHIRSRSYVKPILQSIRSYQYPELQVYFDPERAGSAGKPSTPAIVRWLFAFNLPCYGAALRLASRADATDGLLDVCTFRRGSLWHGLRYAAAVLSGRHERLADCTACRVRRLKITSEAEVPYQLDGDPGGVLPVEVETLPGRLTLVVPAAETKEEDLKS